MIEKFEKGEKFNFQNLTENFFLNLSPVQQKLLSYWVSGVTDLDQIATALGEKRDLVEIEQKKVEGSLYRFPEVCEKQGVSFDAQAFQAELRKLAGEKKAEPKKVDLSSDIQKKEKSLKIANQADIASFVSSLTSQDRDALFRFFISGRDEASLGDPSGVLKILRQFFINAGVEQKSITNEAWERLEERLELFFKKGVERDIKEQGNIDKIFEDLADDEKIGVYLRLNEGFNFEGIVNFLPLIKDRNNARNRYERALGKIQKKLEEEGVKTWGNTKFIEKPLKEYFSQNRAKYFSLIISKTRLDIYLNNLSFQDQYKLNSFFIAEENRGAKKDYQNEGDVLGIFQKIFLKIDSKQKNISSESLKFLKTILEWFFIKKSLQKDIKEAGNIDEVFRSLTDDQRIIIYLKLEENFSEQRIVDYLPNMKEQNNVNHEYINGLEEIQKKIEAGGIKLRGDPKLIEDPLKEYLFQNRAEYFIKALDRRLPSFQHVSETEKSFLDFSGDKKLFSIIVKTISKELSEKIQRSNTLDSFDMQEIKIIQACQRYIFASQEGYDNWVREEKGYISLKDFFQFLAEEDFYSWLQEKRKEPRLTITGIAQEIGMNEGVLREKTSYNREDYKGKSSAFSPSDVRKIKTYVDYQQEVTYFDWCQKEGHQPLEDEFVREICSDGLYKWIRSMKTAYDFKFKADLYENIHRGIGLKVRRCKDCMGFQKRIEDGQKIPPNERGFSFQEAKYIITFLMSFGKKKEKEYSSFLEENRFKKAYTDEEINEIFSGKTLQSWYEKLKGRLGISDAFVCKKTGIKTAKFSLAMYKEESPFSLFEIRKIVTVVMNLAEKK